jgi:hypothetical protein
VSATPIPIAKFRLGQIVATSNALSQLVQAEIFRGIQRHQAGDWGDVSECDHAANEKAFRDNTRILSVYTTDKGVKFRIITEADRSATTVLLPEDY